MQRMPRAQGYPPPALCLFVAFPGASQEVEFKNTKNKLFAKKSMSKVFYKNNKKHPMSFSFPPLFLLRFWTFLYMGSSEHQKQFVETIPENPKISTHPLAVQFFLTKLVVTYVVLLSSAPCPPRAP
jgi:hypothetical protein